jgi:hypothetical protein
MADGAGDGNKSEEKLGACGEAEVCEPSPFRSSVRSSLFLACSCRCALQPVGINNQTSTNLVTTSLTRCLDKAWRRIAIFP